MIEDSLRLVAAEITFLTHRYVLLVTVVVAHCTGTVTLKRLLPGMYVCHFVLLLAICPYNIKERVLQIVQGELKKHRSSSP